MSPFKTKLVTVSPAFEIKVDLLRGAYQCTVHAPRQDMRIAARCYVVCAESSRGPADR
ncbi:regulatory protein [Anopheles sinensis]|uniref:Regulatory protein n=1 Tax=Anopheles sinensis TaxID=74873 RepID=A0A084WR64_ANOSI|nr:regulatory protein [Anopheles sinensis]